MTVKSKAQAALSTSSTIPHLQNKHQDGRPRLLTPTAVTMDPDQWKIMDDITTFWLPNYLLFAVFSRSRVECDTHFGALLTLSFSAVILYRAHRGLRPIGGILRWLVMPLVSLHAVLHESNAFWMWSSIFVTVRFAQVVLWWFCTPDAAPKDGKMRILLAGDSLPPKVDGVAVRAGHTVRMLQALGHTVHVVTSIRPSDQPLYGAQVTQLPGFRSSFYPQHSITIPSWGLLHAFFAFRPHVVHILDESFLAAATQMVASSALVPTVWSHHSRLDLFAVAYIPFLGIAGFNFFAMHILRRMFAAQGDVHLAVGEDMRAQLRAAACSDVSLWECGCDCDSFNPVHRLGGWPPSDGPAVNIPSQGAGGAAHNLRYTLSLGQPSRPVILYVGRVAPEKNLTVYPALLEAMRVAALREGWLEPSWVFVGDGPALPGLKRALEGKPALFLGQLQHGAENNTLGRVYATSDVFYSPSLSETLGQVFQEAMASGTPPVGARAGGVPEAFTHGVEGFLVEPDSDTDVFVERSVEAIVAALKARAAPKDASHPLAHISDRGRARAERKSWLEALSQAVAAYNRSISTRWYVA